jgi:hypothetical protein
MLGLSAASRALPVASVAFVLPRLGLCLAANPVVDLCSLLSSRCWCVMRRLASFRCLRRWYHAGQSSSCCARMTVEGWVFAASVERQISVAPGWQNEGAQDWRTLVVHQLRSWRNQTAYVSHSLLGSHPSWVSVDRATLAAGKPPSPWPVDSGREHQAQQTGRIWTLASRAYPG